MSSAVIAMVANGVTKTFYVDDQSEPDFLGWDMLALLKPVISGSGTEASTKAQVVALQALPGRQITQAEFDAWKVGHPTITTIAQFYTQLASIQGDVAAMLNFGIYQDYVTFTSDPGYQLLDWGYLIDFDTRVFEVYRGAQVKAPTRGRLVGVARSPNINFKQSYPLQMTASFTFAQVAASALPVRWWAN